MIDTFKQPNGFYRNVFALMIPIILQNIITQTVTLADTFMVGVLGEQSLAAVTLAATPMFVFTIFTFGVQSGAGILVSQYWGKGNTSAINRVLGVGLYFSIIITFGAAVILSSFPQQILNLVTSEKSLVGLGVPYARITGFATACNAISMIYISCQRSMENPRLGVIVLSISALFNVFGNWVLIFGKFGFPALGIEGAAIATLCSRIIEVIIIAIYAMRNSKLPIKIMLLLKPGFTIFRDFVKYSIPVLVNEGLWGLGAMLYPVIFGHMAGAGSILASYNIAGNLERLFAVATFASGAATAVIIGREIGAGRREHIISVAKSLMALGLLLGLASCAILMVARFTVLVPIVFPLFDLSKEATSNATIMLTILACITPVRTLAFTMGIGILRGGGDVKALMYIDVGSLYFVGIPMAAITGLILKADIGVVYSSLLLEDAIKLVFLYFRVRSKKWINDVTREQLE